MSETPQDQQSPTLVDLVAAMLTEEGYRAKIDGSAIMSGFGGVKVVIKPYDDNTLQIRCYIIRSEDSAFNSADINKFNTDYRFIKLHSDEEDDYCLTLDYPFDALAEGAVDTLRNIALLFEGGIHSLRSAFSDARERAQVEAAADDALR